MLNDSKNPGGYQIITYNGSITAGKTYNLPDEIIEQCKSRKPIIFQVIDPEGEGDAASVIFYQFTGLSKEDNILELDSQYYLLENGRGTMYIKQLLIDVEDKTMVLNTAANQIGV